MLIHSNSLPNHFFQIFHPTSFLPGPDTLLLVSNWSQNFYQCRNDQLAFLVSSKNCYVAFYSQIILDVNVNKVLVVPKDYFPVFNPKLLMSDILLLSGKCFGKKCLDETLLTPNCKRKLSSTCFVVLFASRSCIWTKTHVHMCIK